MSLRRFREAWNEWQEDNIEEEEMTIVCLFCDDSFVEADKLLNHMNVSRKIQGMERTEFRQCCFIFFIQDGHQFDLRKIVKDDKMNFYDRVKFINFIRKLVSFDSFFGLAPYLFVLVFLSEPQLHMFRMRQRRFAFVASVA